MVADRIEWVLLAYRLPREPSAPRVTIWRKLRRLGVAQLLDGLVALPADARTREQLDWLADEVLESNGEAWVWLGRLASAGQERSVAERMARSVAADYAAVTEEATACESELDDAVRRRVVARLRRELQRIGRRDYFPPVERESAVAAVDRLASTVAAR